MPADLAALAAILLCVTGVVGIVIPVLPGSLFVGIGLLVWAVFGDAPWPWAWFALGVVLLVIGSVASGVLTGGEMKRRGIPRWPVLVALIVGVIAGVYIPVVGLVLGFAVGLWVCEWIRVKDVKLAFRTSVAAIRAVGLGMLIELACAMMACSVLGLSMVVTWLW